MFPDRHLFSQNIHVPSKLSRQQIFKVTQKLSQYQQECLKLFTAKHKTEDYKS